MATVVKDIRAAIRAKDAKLLSSALAAATSEGLTDRQCYRIGLSEDPTLTHEEWEDIKLAGNA